MYMDISYQSQKIKGVIMDIPEVRHYINNRLQVILGGLEVEAAEEDKVRALKAVFKITEALKTMGEEPKIISEVTEQNGYPTLQYKMEEPK